MRLTVIGTGYVGLNTGVAAAYIGHDVVCVDKDPDKIALLKEGVPPIHEQGLRELLAEVGPRMTFTEDTPAAVRDADVVIIAVGTPSKANGEADTSYVEAAAQEIAQGLQPGRTYTIVVKSTVPIGSNRRVAHVVTRTLEARGVDADVHFASNPEFLREGFALHDTFYPDRIVVGADHEAAAKALRQLYEPILEQTFAPPAGVPQPPKRERPPLVETDATSAEMIKYASNAFLATKISFANEIAGLAERVGADITEVTRGMGLDSRIGPRFLGAGLGWGGSCFPKDTAALIAVGSEYDYDMPITEAARRMRLPVLVDGRNIYDPEAARDAGFTYLGIARPDTMETPRRPASSVVGA